MGSIAEQNSIADDCECTEEISGTGCLLFLSLVLIIAVAIITIILKLLFK